ncbi:hypothetical protein QF026_004718 [Streptomyces aurantiacus]|nr:hypothetical protein [Streptomyces aurantiacus]
MACARYRPGADGRLVHALLLLSALEGLEWARGA